jgi:hypothetical protein
VSMSGREGAGEGCEGFVAITFVILLYLDLDLCS